MKVPTPSQNISSKEPVRKFGKVAVLATIALCNDFWTNESLRIQITSAKNTDIWPALDIVMI